jgi:hypothetical protein
MITNLAFFKCVGIHEITFAPGSQIKGIYGFRGCSPLCRISFPASLQTIGVNAFSFSESLCEAIFESNVVLEKDMRQKGLETLRRIEVRDTFPKLGRRFRRHFKGLILLRRFTLDGQWALLLKNEHDCYALDAVTDEIGEIPDVVNDGDDQFVISRISDRIALLCASRSIKIPSYISSIETNFHSLYGYKATDFVFANPLQGLNFLYLLRRSLVLIIVLYCVNLYLTKVVGFYKCDSLCLLEIPASAEIVGGFDECRSLERISFPPNSRLRKISGFGCCSGLCELLFPPSMRKVAGFPDCPKLQSISFGAGSRVRFLERFTAWTSFCRIDVPASVEEIVGFMRSGLHHLILEEGTKIRRIRKNQKDAPVDGAIFVDYQEVDLKSRRRRFQLGCARETV